MRMYRYVCLLMALFLLVGGAATGAAAAAAEPAAEPEEAQQAPPEPEPDVFGRDTPAGLASNLIEALADEDYGRAVNYLDLRELPASSREARGAALAQQLQSLLDAGGNIAPRWQLSNTPTGRVDDGRPLELEQIGTLPGPDGAVELLAERVEIESGNGNERPIWQIATQTLDALPELVAARTAAEPFIDRLLPPALEETHFLGAPVGHWLILLAVVVVAFAVTRIVLALLLFTFRLAWRGEKHRRMHHVAAASAGPLSLYLASWIYFLATQTLGVSIVARQHFGRLVEIIAVVSLVWFAWRMVDAFADFTVERMSQRGQLRALSAAMLLRRSLKALLIGVALVFVLSVAGIDVTAGLAALGIGGLALALGAQKTVENFVGSLTVIADQPIRVGDYCVIGSTAGTVEDIGMRSTRIRTLNRTVVTIPNGELANLQIENFAPRDRFLFNPKLGLRYETTPDQIRYLLVELRALLYAHPNIDGESARVRFVGLASDSLQLEFFSYVNAANVATFLEVQEDLLLRIMDIVAESGTAFAFPSRTLYLAQDTPADTDRRSRAEAAVQRWRDADEMQLPSFDPERIAELRATIDYPPRGSHLRRVEEEAQPTLFPEEPAKR